VNSLAKLRVLLLEDDISLRACLHEQLSDAGYQCDAAVSVADALELARAHEPDLIISDYHLGEPSTGDEAIAAVREMLGKEVPALLVTGADVQVVANEMIGNRVHLLQKPFVASTLIAEITAVLQAP